MCMPVLSVGACTTFVPEVCRSQTRALDDLELESQRAVSHLVGAGTLICLLQAVSTPEQT